MIPIVEAKQIACIGCGKTQKNSKRLFRGWKRRGEEVFCGECWRKQYALRAITFQIVSPLDATWEELRNALHTMWRQTTSCSNWMITQLALGDVRRMPGDTKMPPMARSYLYPEARRLYPDLPPQTVASLEQTITRKYRARRYDILWSGRSVLPTFRYPQPFPVHNQSWHAEWIKENVPAVIARIGARKFSLRLKGGARYRRQLAAYHQIAAGTAKSGELTIYQPGDELMCKLVAWLPRLERTSVREGSILAVRTAPDAMLIAVSAKDEIIWRYNADQVSRWVAEHREQLQRWSEDTKAEERHVPAFAARRQQTTQKYHNRMQSICYQAAAYVAGYASRRRLATVRYDDRERKWCKDFPWETLRSRLSVILDERGINLEIVASNQANENDAGPLAKE